MKAVVLTEEGLALREVPAPEPKPNEVLVKVAASGLNRADLIMAAGRPHGRSAVLERSPGSNGRRGCRRRRRSARVPAR